MSKRVRKFLRNSLLENLIQNSDQISGQVFGNSSYNCVTVVFVGLTEKYICRSIQFHVWTSSQFSLSISFGFSPVSFQIHDWPSLKDRGVLLDLSKGRIPTMDTLRNIIVVLASVKINQVGKKVTIMTDICLSVKLILIEAVRFLL